MANDATKNPWVLDTAATITTGLVYLEELIWHPNAADNDLLVEDSAGSDVWSIRAVVPAPNNEAVGVLKEDFGGKGKIVKGFVLHTIDGGSLKVHIR